MKNDTTEDNGKLYLSHIIRDEYKSWKQHNIIVINAPTGCGKTHFCLNTYLKYLESKNQNMLYLVNRSILKKQLLEEVNFISNRTTLTNENPYPLKSHIYIDTYQNIEKSLSVGKDLSDVLFKYDVVVYDEAHYFFSDSNFNPYTKLSYDYLRFIFKDKIQIFMSATMNNILPFLQKYAPYNNFSSNPMATVYKTYEFPKCYSYINLKWFSDRNKLLDIIKNSLSQKEKWLIFVDSKSYGQDLYKALKETKNITSENIVYIDTDYKKNESAYNAVDKLSKDNFIEKNIIITTSVMDNGISFHDTALRNIVIFADTEEEFIQMLGRKRQDEKPVTVYVWFHNIKHFTHRLNNVRNNISVYNKCSENICSTYPTTFVNYAAKSCGLSYDDKPALNTVELYLYKIKNILEINKSSQANINIFDIGMQINPIDSQNAREYINYVNMINRLAHRQQIFFNSLLQDDFFYSSCKSFIYSYMGIISINQFSFERLIMLEDFYQNMIKELKNDPLAFAKQVCKWLNLPEENFINIENIETDHRNALIQIIEKYIDIDLNSDQNQQLKKEMIPDMKYYLTTENGFNETECKNLTQNERNITAQKFNRICIAANLPYEMEKPNSRTFRIHKIDPASDTK